MAHTYNNETGVYYGKVRDVHYIGDKLIVLEATNRISAFDVVLPELIPYKGQVLNQIAAHMLIQAESICPTWFIKSPTPNTSLGYKCTPFAIEIVVRATLTGHAWRTYNSGLRSLCGVALPNGMKEHDAFANAIITPSTKAAQGHDEDITADQIIQQGLATADQWNTLCKYALALFAQGQATAQAQGLTLADTKYEFGLLNGNITLLDEIHTPDSSRYFYTNSLYHYTHVDSSVKPVQLSKEFVREWLLENNFMGKPGQVIPTMSSSWVATISKRYIELYEQIIGAPFVPDDTSEATNTKLVQQALDALM